MNDEKRYYKYLDILRIFLCIAVLLYHLNILKGGFLAVCSFFVLSGFLSFKAADKAKKFSIIDYYKKRIIGIYLPLFIVIAISIFAISLNSNIIWLNLKPEAISSFLGYNNFWQLSVNSDYFAHHISSPFMHFWYIAILLQFDLIFPFIYLIIKKIMEKVDKRIICFALLFFSFWFLLYFLYISNTHEIMYVYYDTFSRFFSIFFGLCVGVLHSYKSILIPECIRNLDNKFLIIIFYFYIVLSFVLFILVKNDSMYYASFMAIVSFITCRIIDYSVLIKPNKFVFDDLIKYLSSISYLVYLVQYPVIFMFQYADNYSIFYIIVITLIISCFIKFCLNFKVDKNILFKSFRYLCLSSICAFSFVGFLKFYNASDHTQEMEDLKNLLSQNSQNMVLKQEEYKQKVLEEQNDWNNILSDLDNSEAEISNMVSNLPIVGVGDSVMLGAVGSLYNKFPNGYFDAKVNRTDYDANAIFVNLNNQGILGNPVVIHLGTNGQCGVRCRDVIMNTIGDRHVFLVNVTNDYEVNVNSDYVYYAATHDNVDLIDWYSASLGHSEYFYADGIHLNPTGQVAYANVVYDSIYNYYLNEFNEKKNKLISEHENLMKQKISFYGNDLLLNVFDELQINYPDAKYNIDPNYDFDSLLKTINKEKSNGNLNYKLIFAFDNSIDLDEEKYNQLIEACSGHKIYIFSMNPNLKIVNENVSFVNFSDEVKNRNYLLADKIHLNKEGNVSLINGFKDILK